MRLLAKLMGGMSYWHISRDHIALNEGGRFFNFTWKPGFAYLYIGGRRWVFA